jgi:hypothetical protein
MATTPNWMQAQVFFKRKAHKFVTCGKKAYEESKTFVGQPESVTQLMVSEQCGKFFISF